MGYNLEIILKSKEIIYSLHRYTWSVGDSPMSLGRTLEFWGALLWKMSVFFSVFNYLSETNAPRGALGFIIN